MAKLELQTRLSGRAFVSCEWEVVGLIPDRVITKRYKTDDAIFSA